MPTWHFNSETVNENCEATPRVRLAGAGGTTHHRFEGGIAGGVSLRDVRDFHRLRVQRRGSDAHDLCVASMIFDLLADVGTHKHDGGALHTRGGETGVRHKPTATLVRTTPSRAP